ncbi:MAG TPA: Asp-tRNA(Asn)/Glu-tRNA(Gln) amidotransferase subunit GatC [Vicinamibacterales bacterium]|nr:Asp-tRNA(Asn)/Glu-tRNA(Gln) amidotransferase subunit GatC [Vicinamibacterales bacterium]
MGSQLTRADVERIAELARLAIEPGDAPRFAEQLSSILDYATSVQRVDTTNVPPHAGVAVSPLRADSPVDPLDRHAVLEQAPDANVDAGLFRVPKVL